MHSTQPYLVLTRDISWFRPSEQVDERHATELAREIAALGRWITPIPVEHASGIVMDGNHRLRAAALLGLRQLPCVALAYTDARVRVTHWGTDDAYPVAHIFDTIAAHQLLAYKSTQHSFVPPLPRIDVALGELGYTAPAADRLPTFPLERA